MGSCLYIKLHLIFSASDMPQGPVGRRPISANPGLNFNLGFYISLFKSCLMIIFFVYFQSISINKQKTKRFKLNFFFKLSDLKSNFIPTLGYLNPALNNPAQNTSDLYLELSIAVCSRTAVSAKPLGILTSQITLPQLSNLKSKKLSTFIHYQLSHVNLKLSL